MIFFTNKTKNKITREITHDLEARLTRIAYDAATEYTNTYFTNGFDGLKDTKNQNWMTWNFKPQHWLKNAIEDKIIDDVNLIFNEKLNAKIDEFIKSEEFIDKIISRINNKQLAGK